MLLGVGAVMHPLVSFSPLSVLVTGLRSGMLVYTADTGRPFRAWTATSRGVSTSIQVGTTRTAASTTQATASLFVPSKGSPNSERRERIRFFSSLILLEASNPAAPPRLRHPQSATPWREVLRRWTASGRRLKGRRGWRGWRCGSSRWWWWCRRGSARLAEDGSPHHCKAGAALPHLYGSAYRGNGTVASRIGKAIGRSGESAASPNGRRQDGGSPYGVCNGQDAREDGTGKSLSFFAICINAILMGVRTNKEQGSHEHKTERQ